MENARGVWRDWLMLLFGIWLFFSPWILGFSATTVALWNGLIIGAAVVVFSIAVLSAPHMWEEWVNLILGAWLVISPWILGFSGVSVAVSNFVILGLLVGIDAIWTMVEMRNTGGHAAA
ncbi:MAG TPA: SPW repeat protein [Gammaproteobacteria bacterium]|nr:SPW repeat protein [Gammaproteobacteria bacterium]